jgi:hypothetical protein
MVIYNPDRKSSIVIVLRQHVLRHCVPAQPIRFRHILRHGESIPRSEPFSIVPDGVYSIFGIEDYVSVLNHFEVPSSNPLDTLADYIAKL